jgi:alpha-tubulin suppressor-like RCC1 family protein
VSDSEQGASESHSSAMSADEEEVKTEIVSIKDPTAITFDRLMRPIEAVACGQAHVLVLTD